MAALASGWIQPGDAVSNGYSSPNPYPNVMHYFRYQFMMDPQADPAAFGLQLPLVVADARLRGVYVNGQRICSTPTTLMSYNGTVTDWGTATTVEIYALNVNTSELFGPFTAAIDPSSGAYSLASAPPFATGHYKFVARLTVPSLVLLALRRPRSNLKHEL